jgi:addiction module HigA family antidote
MAETIARDPDRPPVHPGEILREDVLPGLGVSVSAAAVHLGVSRQALHRVLAGTAALSPEMAIRIGKFCGNGPDVWLRMQSAYDLWHAARTIDVSRVPTMRVA